jgi:hypothetical protein
MEEYEQGGPTYEGWASKDPDPDERGKLSVEGALRHAYESAKDAGAKPPYVVARIEVHGDNPISDYKVVIGPTG